MTAHFDAFETYQYQLNSTFKEELLVTCSCLASRYLARPFWKVCRSIQQISLKVLVRKTDPNITSAAPVCRTKGKFAINIYSVPTYSGSRNLPFNKSTQVQYEHDTFLPPYFTFSSLCLSVAVRCCLSLPAVVCYCLLNPLIRNLNLKLPRLKGKSSSSTIRTICFIWQQRKKWINGIYSTLLRNLQKPTEFTKTPNTPGGVLIYFCIRGRAAEQGIIFRLQTPGQGITFYLWLHDRVILFLVGSTTGW